MSHDYTQESTEEDPRMMAFFDSLVQRELDGWSSDDSMSSNEEALYSRIVQLSQSDIDSDDSIPGMEDLQDSDTSYSPFTIAFASVMANQAAEGNDRFPNLNRALERAERAYSNISESDDGSNSDTDSGPGNDDDDNDGKMQGANTRQGLVDQNTEELGESSNQTTSESSRESNRLSELVKKKKEDMKTLLRKKMKECREKSKSHSPQSGVIVQARASESSSTAAQLAVENGKSSATQEEKEGQRKSARLKMLKNLRKRVMSNDSDISDLELHDKTPSTNGASVGNVSEDSCERIQFKKLKFRKRDTSNKDMSMKNSKGRASPDLGPFLQKATTSDVGKALTDAKHLSIDKKSSHNNDIVNVKHKHRHQSHHTRHRHYSSDTKSKSDKSHSKTKSSDHTKGKHSHRELQHGHSYASDKKNHSHKCDSDPGNHQIHSRRSSFEESETNHKSSHRHLEKQSCHRDRSSCDNRHRRHSEYARHCDRNNENSEYHNSSTSKRRRSQHSESGKDRGKHLSTTERNESARSGKCKRDCSKSEKKASSSSDFNSVQPSCSYEIAKEEEEDTDSNDSETELSRDSSDVRHRKMKEARTESDDSDGSDKEPARKTSDIKQQKTRKARSDSESEEEDQPMWMEFKRFQNRLERARKRYKKEKHERKNKKQNQEH